jgi:putative acetyltransferase
MRIRKFRPEDAAELARMHKATVKGINAKDYNDKQIEAWTCRLSAKNLRKSLSKTTCYVAVEKGKLIGYSDLTSKGEIIRLYVHKDFQGKGAGKKLMDKIEGVARKKSMKKIYFHSTITAKEFYKRQGFRAVRKKKIKFGSQSLDVIYMIKKL